MDAENNNTPKFPNKEVFDVELRYKRLQDFAIEINWSKLVDLIVDDYVASGIGELKVPVETMIRIYFLQLRYNLNAAEASLALSKIDVLRDFALIDNKIDVLPEEENIDTFRSLIELKGFAQQFAATFNILPIKNVAKQI